MYNHILILFLTLLLSSCVYGNNSIKVGELTVPVDTVSFKSLGEINNGVLVIQDTIDLRNRKCSIPVGLTIHFKGGVIKNGALVGNMTQLKGLNKCFNRVRILGSWNVPTIKSSFFCDLSYDNAIKDVVALSNPSIKNKIIIEKGNYQVTAYKNGDVCIPVCSNTELVMNGTIKLTPNDYTNYYIIQVSGNNIKIYGNGVIIGDKHTHTGNKGEWGMGINLKQAHHVSICGLIIKDCWGDCIYVGTESSDVTIEKCVLDHGRRQGISITSANGVKISNCTISNVYGTAPEYAIDVEPNKGEIVDNVIIKNVTVEKCRGGFLVYGKASGARVGKVSINGCKLIDIPKMPISFQKCDSGVVDNCIFKNCKHKELIGQEGVKNMVRKKIKVE